MEKIINKPFSYYFCNMNKYLIKSTFIQSLLFILESIITLTQFLEIYNNEYHRYNKKSEINKISIALKVFKFIDINDEKIIFYSLISFILLFDIIYFLYDYIICQNKILSIILINFYEIFYFRLLFIFYITIIFRVKEFYFFISLLVVFFHLVITIYNFQLNHLYYFSPTFISLPYDNLSSLIDISNSISKVFISLSLNNGFIISKYFYLLSFIVYSVSSGYFIVIMICKSYYIMNNLILSKIKLAFNFGTFITLIFMYCHGTKRILSISFLYVIFYAFLMSLIGTIVYNPFNLIFIKKNHHDSNAIYYLFANFSDLQNKIKFQQAINSHRRQCNICELCISLKDDKLLKNKDDNIENDYEYFSVIYKGNNKYFKLLLFIMKNYIESKFKMLSNNPSILMNILYFHYSKIFKNQNINVNFQLIFLVLNEQNKTLIEEQKILINQLILMNDFIYFSKKTLAQIKKIIHNNTYIDSPSQFEDMITLSNLLNNLDSNHFKKKLFIKKNLNNKNNSFYSYMICSVFYEELLNENILNINLQIRENFSQYDEIITFLYHNNNNITLLLEIVNFNIKIIRVGKDLINHLNSSLYELFPKNLEQCQREKIKEILLDFISINTKSTVEYIQYNIPEMKFIIIEKDNELLYYKLLNLKINLLYKNKMSDELVFNGQYSINKNIIITMQKKNLEHKDIIIGFGNKKLHYPVIGNPHNVSLQNFITENNINEELLKFDFSFEHNNNQYNVYKYNIKNRKHNSSIHNSTYLNLDSSLLEQSLIDKYKRDENSVASMESTSSIRSYANNFLKKYNNDDNNLSLIKGLFKILQMIEMSFLFLLIVMTIVQFTHENNLKNKFHKDYNLIGDFRLYYRKLYHLISSFLNLICIAEKPENLNCINYMNEYTKRYNNINSQHTINFTKVLEDENFILANSFGDTLYELQFSVTELNNKVMNEIFQNNFTFRQVVPNYSTKTVSVININVSFNEALELVVNSFIILNSNSNKYTYETFYIINYEYNVFDNLNFDAGVDESRIEFYQLMLNFYNYERVLKGIRYFLDDYYEKELISFRFISLVYQIIILFIKILILSLLFFYVNHFYKILLIIINSIRIKLKNGEESIDFKTFFESKILNLEQLIQLYSENPVTILSKLEHIYYKYNKEIKEFMKKQNNEKEELEDKYKSLIKQIHKKSIFTKRTLKKSRYKKIYQIIMILLIMGIIGIFLIENYLLLLIFSDSILVIKLIKNQSSSEASAYKNVIYFQLMLYLNQTEEEISLIENYESIDSHIQEKFIDIFISEQTQKQVSSILPFLSELVSLDCKDFYDLANDQRLNIINEKYPNEKIYVNLSYYCSNTKAMNAHKSEIVFQNLFGLIMDGIKSIGLKNYEGIIKFLEKDYLYKCLLFNYFIFRPLRSIVNFQVIVIGTKNIMKLFDNFLLMNIIVDAISDLMVIFIIVFVFIIGIEKNYKKIVRLRNVFRICK